MTAQVTAAVIGQAVIKGDAGRAVTGVASVGAVVDLASLGNGARWWQQCRNGGERVATVGGKQTWSGAVTKP